MIYLYWNPRFYTKLTHLAQNLKNLDYMRHMVQN